MPCWTLFQHLQTAVYTKQGSFEVQDPELGIDVCPQICDLESWKCSSRAHLMHPNNKGWWWCWDKEWSLVKPKLEMKKSGNFCIHHPVTFEEPKMACSSEIRSFIWKCLRKNSSCTLVQLLPLAVSWEISVRDFRPVLHPYPSSTSLIFCTLCEAQMGALKTSQMSLSAPSPTYALNEGE